VDICGAYSFCLKDAKTDGVVTGGIKTGGVKTGGVKMCELSIL